MRPDLRSVELHAVGLATVMWITGCGLLAGPELRLAGEIIQISSELTRTGTEVTVRARFTNASERDLFLGFCDVAVHVGAQHLVEGQWRLYPGSICVTTAVDRRRGEVSPGESVEVNRIFDHTAVGTFRLVVWFGPEAGRPWEYKAVTESFELH